MAIPQMRSRIVGPVLGFIRSKGGDADALMREFGLPSSAEADAEVVLPLPALHAFLEAAERESKDPFLGIHVAIAYRRGLFGVMEYASRSAPTLREALVRVVRFAKLMNDLVLISLEEQDGTAKIEQRVEASPLCLGRHANEFFVATLIDQARLLSGERCIPELPLFSECSTSTPKHRSRRSPPPRTSSVKCAARYASACAASHRHSRWWPPISA